VQEQLIIIPASGETNDHDAVVQGAGLLDLVTCTGVVTVILDGNRTLTMRMGDVKRVDAFKRIRLVGSPQTVTLQLGFAHEDARHSLTAEGPGTVSPATATYVNALGVIAGGTSSIPSVPLGRTLVAAYVSLDPLAPGPVYVGLGTFLGGPMGLLLMPGETSPPLTQAPVPDTGSNNIRIANPNSVTVAVYVYSEYIA
jgi:hypothetical protein